jgi:hypothetical protein
MYEYNYGYFFGSFYCVRGLSLFCLDFNLNNTFEISKNICINIIDLNYCRVVVLSFLYTAHKAITNNYWIN